MNEVDARMSLRPKRPRVLTKGRTCLATCDVCVEKEEEKKEEEGRKEEGRRGGKQLAVKYVARSCLPDGATARAPQNFMENKTKLWDYAAFSE